MLGSGSSSCKLSPSSKSHPSKKSETSGLSGNISERELDEMDQNYQRFHTQSYAYQKKPNFAGTYVTNKSKVRDDKIQRTSTVRASLDY